MLKAIPKNWFSWDFTVIEDSTPVAEIAVSWWREKGELTVRGSAYRVYREGPMWGAFVLESGGAILARAEKPSALRRSNGTHFRRGRRFYGRSCSSKVRRRSGR